MMTCCNATAKLRSRQSALVHVRTHTKLPLRLHVLKKDGVIVRIKLERASQLYRNNLKNRALGKEAAQILESGASGIVQEQGASEDPRSVAKLTPPNPDSLICFGINAGEASFLFEQYLAQKSFAHLLSPLPLTSFSKAVLEELCNTPFGKTISYSELAERIGRPTARRAVAMALHHNPIPLFIPCHRVIAKDGSLGGFAYGLAMKKEILSFEREHLTKKVS